MFQKLNISHLAIRLVRASVVAVALFGGVGTATANDVFETLNASTVKVRTAISVPFIRDEGQGAEGAGFIVDEERGWIATNAHVAGYGPSRVEVAFKGEDFQPAEVVYVDPRIDFALLAIEAHESAGGSSPLSVECRDLPVTGESVAAFGHPWGLDFTASRGIVSGISVFDGEEWIQTDAPLNAGNSGGPLVSLDSGKVVGISAASVAGEDVQDLNFAVPMVYVCPILEMLREGRDPTPADFPVALGRQGYGAERLTVAAVPPAGASGLALGDEILSVGGSETPPTNLSALYGQLRGRKGSVPVTVLRDGKPVELEVALGSAVPVTERRGLMVAGVVLAPAAADLSWHEGVGHLMVHWIEPGSAGYFTDLDYWDLVEAINGEPVRDLEALREAIDTAADRRLRITVRRLTDRQTGFWEYLEVSLPGGPVKSVSR